LTEEEQCGLFHQVVGNGPHTREDIEDLRDRYRWDKLWSSYLKDIRPFNLFVRGPKPALYLSGLELEPYMSYLNEYYINVFGRNRVLVTKESIIPGEYLSEEGNIVSHAALGKLLGFPDIAISDFEGGGPFFHVDYNGMVYSCREENLWNSMREVQRNFSGKSCPSQGVYLAKFAYGQRTKWERVVNL